MPSKRPLYSKRHYEDAAEWLPDLAHYGLGSSEQARIARSLANHFAADNPLFDRARFLKAAGVEHA